MGRSAQRRAAAVALYQEDVTDRPAAELLDRDAKPFTRELVDGVAREEPELDRLIERYSQGWTLDRIAPLERSIMRVALYEVEHREDVPTEVALDEAVGLAKQYCGADTPGFVNGILGAAVRATVGEADE